MGLKEKGMQLGMKAVGKLMESQERAERVMKAVQTVQKGREVVDETAARLLNLSQLPSKADIKELGRQAGRLRREAKKILAELDELDADRS
ncbi:MAG: hypothetical protein IT383_06255 [Deltaproteobacteria bacterium]|nr:hypothetical protein [Deltaproteobacteria bacterium]